MANHLYMNAVGGVYIPRDIGLMDRYLYPPRHRKIGPIISFLMKPSSIRIMLLLTVMIAYISVGNQKFTDIVYPNMERIVKLSLISVVFLFMLR